MNIVANFNGRVHESRIVVPAGQTKTFKDFVRGPAVVTVHCASGATANVTASTSPLAAIEADNGFFFALPWAASLATTGGAASRELLVPLNAIQVTALGGDVTLEVLQ